jgi:hypothetical protein
VSAAVRARPAVRVTRIVCGQCLAPAPISLVVDLRARVLEHLRGLGWRISLGEATCDTCCKVEDALAPRRAS